MVCGFAWVKGVASCFSSSLTTEVRKFATPFSLGTDALMVREHCWLVEGKATRQIKQQIEERIDNCIPGTIIVRSLDTPLWQEIQITRHSLPKGAWTAGHETRVGIEISCSCLYKDSQVATVFSKGFYNNIWCKCGTYMWYIYVLVSYENMTWDILCFLIHFELSHNLQVMVNSILQDIKWRIF